MQIYSTWRNAYLNVENEDAMHKLNWLEGFATVDDGLKFEFGDWAVSATDYKCGTLENDELDAFDEDVESYWNDDDYWCDMAQYVHEIVSAYGYNADDEYEDDDEYKRNEN